MANEPAAPPGFDAGTPQHAGVVRCPEPTQSSPISKPFSEVLKGQSNTTSLQAGVQNNFKGFPSVRFTESDIQTLAQRFRFALIGTCSSSIPFKVVESFLKRLGLKGDFSLGRLSQNKFLINLKIEEDYHRIFLRRSWMIGKKIIVITKWSPVILDGEDNPVIPLWVSMPSLPIHLHDQRALFFIASSLGRPLKVDDSTLNFSRPALARFCVEIDVSKPLPSKIHIHMGSREVLMPIIFENAPAFCSTCRKLGHHASECCHFTDVEMACYAEPNNAKTLLSEDIAAAKGKKKVHFEDSVKKFWVAKDAVLNNTTSTPHTLLMRRIDFTDQEMVSQTNAHPHFSKLNSATQDETKISEPAGMNCIKTSKTSELCSTDITLSEIKQAGNLTSDDAENAAVTMHNSDSAAGSSVTLNGTRNSSSSGISAESCGGINKHTDVDAQLPIEALNQLNPDNSHPNSRKNSACQAVVDPETDTADAQCIVLLGEPADASKSTLLIPGSYGTQIAASMEVEKMNSLPVTDQPTDSVPNLLNGQDQPAFKTFSKPTADTLDSISTRTSLGKKLLLTNTHD